MSQIRHFAATCLLLMAGAAFGCSQDVKVGAVISETGAMATPYGRQVKRGLDLALEEINQDGGFKGSPVQLIYRDDASDPETGHSVALDLIENEGIEIIVGAISSPVTLSIAPLCEEKNVILLSPSSSSPRISTEGDFIFRNYPSDVLEGTAMADFARGLRLKRVVIFAQDNEFGEGLTDVFTERFTSKTRSVLQAFQVNSDNMSDFEGMLEQIKAMEPDGIYIAAYHEPMIALLQLVEASGIDAVVMGNGSVTEETLSMAAEAGEYLVYPQPSFDTASSDPAVSAFVQAFRSKYGEDPDIYAAHGYDALKLLWQAMIDTGFAHPDEVKRGLNKLDGYQGAAGRTAFDELGDVIRYPQLFIVKDGEAMPYEKFVQDGGELPMSQV